MIDRNSAAAPLDDGFAALESAFLPGKTSEHRIQTDLTFWLVFAVFAGFFLDNTARRHQHLVWQLQAGDVTGGFFVVYRLATDKG